ncbi:MAG: DEAD/DEAH box helicase [Promethearchaeota archaeon]
MSLSEFLNEKGDFNLKPYGNKEIFKYINNEKILRALFNNKIFELREIQKDAIKKGLFFRKSFLICAPSGSGKTLIGELGAIHNILQGFGKSIYLVPFKALATEKYFYFKKNYQKYGIKIELSIGDYDIDDSILKDADLIITTYEKMDSILRNFREKDWINEISTVIIDEVHVIGDSDRGPRLESLIVRMNEYLHNPQLICLSATIANPEFFNKWLNSLGNHTILIKSNKRPVELFYKIEITQNKDSTIKKITRKTLENHGQILIFLNSRKSAQQMALTLRPIVNKTFQKKELEEYKYLEKKLSDIHGGNKELRQLVKYGIAFHHAGLLPKERLLIENYYKKGVIKVICCTTTLSAGINLPARVVILKDFKKYTTSGYNIRDFSGFYENGDGFSYFKPFSANEVFQMLGRAGRPGLDSIGYGFILVKDIEERMWVEDFYFHSLLNKPIPKYNNLISGLNKISILKEQVLLRIYEEKKISIEKIKNFFEKTYFWHCFKEKNKSAKIPLEQLLMIKEISPSNILKLHSNPNHLKQILSEQYQVKISELSSNSISGYVKTHYGVYICSFDIDNGVKCACGFKNGISDNFTDDKFAFEFCDHILLFLSYIIKIPNKKLQMYVKDIIPKAVRNQHIISYLIDKGLIIRENEYLRCTHFGKLIIRLYLYPDSGVLIRDKLENTEITSYRDLIQIAFDILKAEYRIRNDNLFNPILDWCDEEPLEEILERYNIMTGDLFSVRDNLERIITFIGIIASHMAEFNAEIRDKLIQIAEMSETLKIRIHYGVREELFDLILRLDYVARIRARILFNCGYRTSSQVKKENPYVLSKKTGLGLKLCKKIIEGTKKS